jgi:hypothetical protein
MINIIKKIKLQGSVIEFKTIDDSFLLMDNLYNVYILDSKKFSLIDSKKLSSKYQPWHNYYRGMSISYNSFLNVPLFGTKKSLLMKYEETFKQISTISWNQEDIEVSKFSHNGNYLAIGGADGRTFIVKSSTSELLTSLEPRPDYISNILFSDDDTVLVVSGFDKMVRIFDIDSNKVLQDIKLNDVVTDMAFWKEKLYMVCKDGLSAIYDTRTKELQTKRIFKDWTTSVKIIGNFAVVSTKSENLYIINLLKHSLTKLIKLSSTGVSKIDILGTNLIISCIDGIVFIADTLSYKDEFDTALKLKNYKKAKELMDKNIFLVFDSKQFDDGWNAVLQDAIILLSKDKLQEALDLAQPFLDDEYRKEEFSYYLEQRTEIAQFIEYTEKRDFANAYKIALSNKSIKNTKYYQELEDYWNKIFSTAKKLMEDGPIANRAKCTELLKPFSLIDQKKHLVSNLINNASVYAKSDEAIKKQDFKSYFLLIDKYEFLKDTNLYERVMGLGESLMTKMIDFQRVAKFDEATKIYNNLQYFTPFKLKAKEIFDEIRLKISIMGSMKSDDRISVYATIEKYSYLKTFDKFIEYHDKVKKGIEDATEKALAGNSLGAYSKLSEYRKIPYFHEKVISIMRMAYLNEFKNVNASEVYIQKSAENYIYLFGKDFEIVKLCHDKQLSDIISLIDDNRQIKKLTVDDLMSSILIYKDI